MHERTAVQTVIILWLDYLVTMVTLIRDSSLIFQLCVSPLTNPEIITNKRTSTLMAVKTLLTQADSFTPNDKSPGTAQPQQSSEQNKDHSSSLLWSVWILSLWNQVLTELVRDANKVQNHISSGPVDLNREVLNNCCCRIFQLNLLMSAAERPSMS